jgi:hypothetical protein
LAQARWLHHYQHSEAAQQLLQNWPNRELLDRFELLCQLSQNVALYQRIAPTLYDFAAVEYVL